jgi:hypothetical protein
MALVSALDIITYPVGIGGIPSVRFEHYHLPGRPPCGGSPSVRFGHYYLPGRLPCGGNWAEGR